MKKILIAALTLSAFAAPALAGDLPSASSMTSVGVATKGKMLVAADGSRLAPIYRVASEGPQIILDGRMVTVPLNTVSMVDGKATTTLTKSQVIALP